MNSKWLGKAPNSFNSSSISSIDEVEEEVLSKDDSEEFGHGEDAVIWAVEDDPGAAEVEDDPGAAADEDDPGAAADEDDPGAAAVEDDPGAAADEADKQKHFEKTKRTVFLHRESV